MSNPRETTDDDAFRMDGDDMLTTYDGADPQAEFGDWCHDCHLPIGIGDCPGCLAVASLGPDDEEEPVCSHCGKALEDFSDLGCQHCDQRHPGFGTTD